MPHQETSSGQLLQAPSMTTNRIYYDMMYLWPAIEHIKMLFHGLVMYCMKVSSYENTENNALNIQHSIWKLNILRIFRLFYSTISVFCGRIVNLVVYLWMSPAGLQEVSWDVANLVVCLWTSPAGLQVLPAESGGIIGCSKPWHMSCEGLQQNPGGIFDVMKLNICLAKAPTSLQVSPVELRRYHWM